MILCCRIPEVPVAALLLRDGEGEGEGEGGARARPLVVGGHPTERKPVLAASPEARAYGVCPGMPLRQAEQLCPLARFEPPDPVAEANLARHLLAGLYALAPRVELQPESGEAYVDLDGLDTRAEGGLEGYARRVAAYLERRLLTRPLVGIGDNKFVAFTAAGMRGSQTSPFVVPRGRERAFLDPLPVAAHLPVEPGTVERLQRFGLRTLGQVAALPLGAMEAQFGKEGLFALRLARGEDSRPLVPWQPPRRLEETSRLDPAVDNLEPLLFLARGIVDRLGARLLRNATAATTVRLRLELDAPRGEPDSLEAILPLRAPASDAADLWPPVAGLLRRQQVRHPVAGVTLRLSGFCPSRSRQLDLLTRRDGRLEDVVRALALLAGNPAVVAEVATVAPQPGVLEERRHLWAAADGALAGARRVASR